MKKGVLGCALVLLGSLSLAGCQKADDGSIILLNFKPEIAKQFPEVAKIASEELGFTVSVESAANGKYEETLRSKISTDASPAIFQINGPVGYANWKEYIADLDGSEVVKGLVNEKMAVKVDGKIKAIPYTEEGYGIIYNKELTDMYFALEGRSKETGANSMDEIKSYATLKKVVEDMQAHKADLGVDGVFGTSGLDGSDSWRITGHAFNLALVGEFGTSVTATPDKFDFKCADNFRNIVDLYVKHSTTTPNTMVNATNAAGSASFADKKAIMFQNGNWATADLTKGGKVSKENLRYLPMYCGINNDYIKEAKQGLCIGTEANWCVNKKLSAKKQENALKFLNWLLCGKGQKYCMGATENGLGFMPPYKGFGEGTLKQSDPLAIQVSDWMNKTDVDSVAWDFTIVPSTDAQRAALVEDLKKYYNSNCSDEAWTTLVANAKTKWAELAKAQKLGQ